MTTPRSAALQAAASSRAGRAVPFAGRVLGAALLGVAIPLLPAAALASEPTPEMAAAIEVVVLSQVASKQCTSLRVSCSRMTDVVKAAGLRAADISGAYQKTFLAIESREIQEAGANRDAFCASAWKQLGPDGQHPGVLERTDTPSP